MRVGERALGHGLREGRVIPTAIILALSCSAKAEHPVTAASLVIAQSDTEIGVITGSSAFADDDMESG